MAGGKVYVYRKPPRRRPPRKVVKTAGATLHAIFYDVGIGVAPSAGDPFSGDFSPDFGGVTGYYGGDILAVVRWSVPVSVETLPSPAIAYNVGVAAESLAAGHADYTVASEWIVGTRVYYDATIPSEARGTSRSDQTRPFEWGGSVTAIEYDTGVPAENLVVARGDAHVSLEINSANKAIFYDVGAQFQLLATSRQDTGTPIEWFSIPPPSVPPVFAPSGFSRLPNFTDADFQLGMQNLLPTGPVWPRDADAQQTQIIGALTQTYVRNAERANNLLSDAFPVQPVELLPEWELSLGLPDPCAGVLPTIQQRQQQVAARFIAGGGQSIAYFIKYAATLGYTITITQFAPFRVGINHTGDPLNGPAWAFAWQVNAPQFSVDYFRVSENSAGDPLAWWGNTVLQCELQRLAPAQTILTFSYS